MSDGRLYEIIDELKKRLENLNTAIEIFELGSVRRGRRPGPPKVTSKDSGAPKK